MFQTPLDVRQIGWRDGRPVWLTLAPLRYHSASLDLSIQIPPEFITDTASVPRFPLAYLLAGGKGNRSAVIHDFPYQFGFWILEDGTKYVVKKKKTADNVFYESLLVDPMSGTSASDAYLMWSFVRTFGRGHWHEEERKIELNPEWSKEGILLDSGTLVQAGD